MDTTQIILLIIIALFVLLRVRKFFAMKSINNYSSVQIKEMLKERANIILLDVRTKNERNAGSIKPSIHIPLHEIGTKVDQLKKHQNQEIVCYCQSGSRSASAAIKLKKLGFNSANMRGGYSSW